jgi:hypothetical protein
VPENSLSSEVANTLAVAMFFGVSPQEVENEWTNADYLDRFEYMMIQNYITAKIRDVE